MIVYRGTGVVVILTIGIIYNTAKYINGKFSRFQAPEDWGSWLFIFIFSLSAVILWIWAYLVNSGPKQVYTDEKTGKQIFYTPKHDCFYIDIKSWAYIMAVLAAIHIYSHFKGGRP